MIVAPIRVAKCRRLIVASRLRTKNAPGLSNACRSSLLAVLSQLLVTQPPVLPKLPGGKQRDDCAENKMPVPERTGFCVTKDEWRRDQP